MSDIFISYASEDKKKAGFLAKILELQGWSVWWDREISTGRIFAEVIEKELDSSKCVIVLWSKSSINKRWVKTEANEGANRDILAPVLIEDVKIPLEFRLFHTANLIGWQGQETYPELNKLLGDVEETLGIPRKVQKKTERDDSKKEEALKRKKKNGKAVDKDADLQQYPEEKVKTKPVAIEKTETEPIVQTPLKSKSEEEKRRKSEEQRGNTTPGTAKKNKLVWLIPSIIVPLISVIVVFFLFSHKPTEEIVSTDNTTNEETDIPTTYNRPDVQNEVNRYHDSEGFYNGSGLDNLLSKTGGLDSDENVIERFLLFEIDSQHTWLITTSKHLFCLLDDNDTRNKGSVVQWKVELDSFELHKVKAYRSSRGNDVVELGRRAPWLYSKHLHPNTSELENEIRRLVKDALGLDP
ncbi:MAG: toll/interleukin-1 receptor domain-containing protein [Candidatus Scalindua sp.]|nr:toll/interleukin-1 receptor domain-containing protein [Candidatus Scalindua sp.]